MAVMSIEWFSQSCGHFLCYTLRYIVVFSGLIILTVYHNLSLFKD